MIEMSSVTGVGQIKEGEVLIVERQDGWRFIAIARQVINRGYEREEIVFCKSKNDYFIMSMFLDGKSWVKNISRLPGVDVTAITNTVVPFRRR